MQVNRFIVGWISSAAGIWRQGDPMDQAIRFPIPAYLVETEHERVLIDTGLHPAAVENAARHYGVPGALAAFEFEQEQSISEQVDVSELTKVVLTHLHFDHAGGLALLDSSTPVFVQRREWEAGQDAAAISRNFFLPGDYSSIEQIVLIDGPHDLLGDGSIRLLPTPGHTPGHQSVCLGEQLVIGADVAHFASTLDDLRFPSFADDFDAQARSAAQLRELRAAGADVVPGHDPDVLHAGSVALS